MKKDLDDLFKNVLIPSKDPRKPPQNIVKKDEYEFGRRATKDKMRRNHNQDVLLKLKMITAARSIKGILFLESVIKKI